MYKKRKEYGRAIHLVTVHCIISFESLEECYLMNNTWEEGIALNNEDIKLNF